MSWEIFEPAAARYEQWYEAGRGRLADVAERRLLDYLLQPFPNARSALEVGCGTGHFAAFLEHRGLEVVGLDRSPAMLAEAAGRSPSLSLVLGDAHTLPFRNASVDLTIFVTTVEFLADPVRALHEAVRVARQGIVLIALNRLSLGALSRRWGPQSSGALLSKARDFSARELRRQLEEAAGSRAASIGIASTLLPDGLSAHISRIPLGDIVGGTLKLRTEGII